MQYRRSSNPITPAVLSKYLSDITGCEVEVEDFVKKYTFGVVVIFRSDSPSVDFQAVKKAINRLKQAHMSYRLGQGFSQNIHISTEEEHSVFCMHMCGMHVCGTLPDADPLA